MIAVDEYRIVATHPGGPEVLAKQELQLRRPGADEVLIRQTAVGVNFVDVYHRSGLYPGPHPRPLGGEAAGIIEAVGSDVEHLKVGDRVAYGTGGQGAYATSRLVPADHVFILPAAIAEDTAAAAMLKGLTAAYLVGPCGRVAAGDWVLVHAAAGGIGSILVQWLLALDAQVIAHVGSPGKEDKVRHLGCRHVTSCDYASLPEVVRGISGSDGAKIVFDGVGLASWQASILSVAPRGLIVSFGNASGVAPPVEPLALAAAGSVFLTRPKLQDYTRNRMERAELAESLFSMIKEGHIEINIGLRLPLSAAADAHRALERRATEGSTILIP